MKNKTTAISKKSKKKKQADSFCLICWLFIPLAAASLLVLDGIGLYCFNSNRLLVIGICTLIVLLPFFSEITIKSISIKKESKEKKSAKK